MSDPSNWQEGDFALVGDTGTLIRISEIRDSRGKYRISSGEVVDASRRNVNVALGHVYVSEDDGLRKVAGDANAYLLRRLAEYDPEGSEEENAAREKQEALLSEFGGDTSPEPEDPTITEAEAKQEEIRENLDLEDE